MTSEDLRARVMAVFRPGSKPMTAAQLGDRLQLKDRDREHLARLLPDLEGKGELFRGSKDRWGCAESLGGMVGVIRFSARSGTARLLDPTSGDVLALVREGRSSNALHGDRVLAKPVASAPGRAMRRGWIPDARVERVLKRERDSVTGILRRQGRSGLWFVEVDEPGFVHLIRISDPGAAQGGDRVAVTLHDWRSAAHPLTGEIVENFGRAGSTSGDRAALIKRFALRREFDAEVLADVEQLSDTLPPDPKRRDLREQLVITIDPGDARDHDDAIAVEESGDGGWRVWVHIADVAAYVQPGTALDAAAFARATSVYLPGEVIAMLPRRLSDDLCSLLPDADRPAVTVEFRVSKAGAVSHAVFHRSLIRVARKLAYGDALEMIRGAGDDAVAALVRRASGCARSLRKGRFANGSLDLDFPELKIHVDASGNPERVEIVEHDESHQLIEELMLAANDAVAADLKNSGRGTLYRIHETPDPDRLLELRETLAIAGVTVGNLQIRAEVQRMLDQVKGREDERALKIAFLRSLRLAVYHPEALGHYGLAKTNYTHFTSPIRRYPDLVVHRALGMLHGWLPAGPLAPVDLNAAAEHCSAQERAAARAEAEGVKQAQLILLERVVGSTQKALVTDVKQAGVAVELVEVGFDGFLPSRVLGGRGLEFDPAKRAFQSGANQRARRGADRYIQHGSGIELRAGVEIAVRIEAVDRERGDLTLGLAENPRG